MADLYSAGEQRVDGRRGRRDGRRRFPTYSGARGLIADGLPVTTQYHEGLLSMGRFEINEVFRAFVESLDAYRQRLGPLRSALAGDERLVVRCQEELARSEERRVGKEC